MMPLTNKFGVPWQTLCNFSQLAERVVIGITIRKGRNAAMRLLQRLIELRFGGQEHGNK